VVELCGFLSIPPVHCSGELQGLSGELQGLFRKRGNCKDSLSCKELQGLHYRGIVVDPGGKQLEHGQVELKCIKSHYPRRAVQSCRQLKGYSNYDAFLCIWTAASEGL